MEKDKSYSLNLPWFEREAIGSLLSLRTSYEELVFMGALGHRNAKRILKGIDEEWEGYGSYGMAHENYSLWPLD